MEKNFDVMTAVAFDKIRNRQSSSLFIKPQLAPMNHRVRQPLISVVKSFYRYKLVIILEMLDIRTCYVTPEKSSTGHRLI